MLTLNIFEIKDADELRNWGEKLQKERHEEALMSMKQEGVRMEAAFLFQINRRDYVIGLIISNGEKKPVDLNMEINKQHLDVLDRCLVKKLPAEVLYCLDQ